MPQPLPPTLTEDCILKVYSDQLLDVRTTSQRELEVLIKWQHLPTAENSWELAACINKEFPEFHLDKEKLHGGCNDRFGTVYKEEAKQLRKLLLFLTVTRHYK